MGDLKSRLKLLESLKSLHSEEVDVVVQFKFLLSEDKSSYFDVNYLKSMLNITYDYRIEKIKKIYGS